jgi:hypothetical protein
MERLGAALAAPTRALAASDTQAGSGRAPADLAVLILAAFTATRVARLVKAGWLVVDGTGMDGLHLLLSDLSTTLMAPLLFVAASGLLVTILAGRHRAVASDFDLACVAAVPVAAIRPVIELTARLGLATPTLATAATWLSYAWAAALTVLAVRQARRRGAR